MKITYYNGRKIRLLKGQTLAIVKEYEKAKGAKPRIALCIIREHFFSTGFAKHTVFDVIQELEIFQYGKFCGMGPRYRSYQFIDVADE